MGGSFCKKVWNGIKCVANAVWTGIKTATKAIVNTIGYIGGIIVEVAITALLVAGTVICGILKKFALTIFMAALALLSIVFLSNMIIFGRDYENQKKKERFNFNANGSNGQPPDLENEKKQKKYNMMEEFLKDVENFIYKVKEKNMKDGIEFLYSFTLGENDEITAKKLDQLGESENGQNVLVTQCYFEYFPFQNKDGIKLILMNEIENNIIGKKILKEIKNSLLIKYKYNFDFYEENDSKEKVNLDNISKIETIEMNAIL